MKHVWILNHYAQRPTQSGGLVRHYSLARHISTYGWSSSIVTSSTDHPSGRQRPTRGLEIVDGIPFLALRTPEYWGNGSDRIRNMLAYARRAVTPRALAPLPRPDVIIGSSPHPAAAMAGLILARRHNVPFVFEIRDLWPEALVDMGRLSDRGFTARTMRAFERRLFVSAKRSIMLWPDISRYVEDRKIPVPPPVWIPNGVDLSAIDEPAPLPDTYAFTLMYYGAHGGANGLANLLDAMRIVGQSPDGGHIRLRLIGSGPEKPALQRKAAQMGLANTCFEAAVPKRQVGRLAAEADAFVFNLIDAPVFRYGISPNKLYDYMAAGRPVIFSCRSSNDPIAECGGGISVEPGDPEALAQAILRLSRMPRETRQAMGDAARRFVETRHDFRVLARDLADVLEEAVADKA